MRQANRPIENATHQPFVVVSRVATAPLAAASSSALRRSAASVTCALYRSFVLSSAVVGKVGHGMLGSAVGDAAVVRLVTNGAGKKTRETPRATMLNRSQ